MVVVLSHSAHDIDFLDSRCSKKATASYMVSTLFENREYSFI